MVTAGKKPVSLHKFVDSMLEKLLEYCQTQDNSITEKMPTL